MNPLRNYAIVTGAYWSFMLTDGALRMLTLLYFHKLGYSSVTLAFLFLFYEFFGMVTNLFGGWLAHRNGLKSTLVYGLALQVVALLGLSWMQEDWSAMVAVPFVMGVQALSGIAKDLTKMSSKTAVKFLVPKEKSASLFKWVSILTGSKNAIKGGGFFVGGLLLQRFGFQQALWVLAAGVLLAFLAARFFLPREIGKAKSAGNKLSGIFEQNREIKILSAARLFLFGARDIWFVVAIPIFLTTAFGWSFSEVGGFMAVWVMLYGGVQSVAPAVLKKRNRGCAPGGKMAWELTASLFACMTVIAGLFYVGVALEWVVVVGLYLFGALFALNSSVHSFLVLDYADADKAAVNVGFYYMANAGGRLLGTLLSGLLYQFGGVGMCLAGSAVFLGCSMLISFRLPVDRSLHETMTYTR
jgi:predicted MFS family arabinose efflux permease